MRLGVRSQGDPPANSHGQVAAGLSLEDAGPTGAHERKVRCQLAGIFQ